ncbi:MAG: hypothetical protein CMP11_00455 [Zetaproteobacteria bacterium]|nr:hypothetical protein [Pseudobdellovibrionaceae bacterium]
MVEISDYKNTTLTNNHSSSAAGPSGMDQVDDKQEPKETNSIMEDVGLAKKLDNYSLESIVELKISRFLDQISTYYPDSFHSMIMNKVEKPLLNQILLRTGGNQVHTARILGINRNTLRKKMKLYGFCS